HEVARARARQPRRACKRRRTGLRAHAAHRRSAGGGNRRAARQHAAWTAWRADGRGRGGTLPLLRRGIVHHRGRAARRRRSRNVVSASNGSLNGRRRVVITGLGAVTPLGLDMESTWSSLLAGETGAGEITQFDHSDYPVHFACEVKGFDATEWIDRK